jgi:hypothetical protein
MAAAPDGPAEAAGLDVDEVRAKAAHARRVARRMMQLGWFVLVSGVLAMVAAVVVWAMGESSFADAFTEFSALLLGTVLTGVATYGTGLNLTMNADRLELALDR